MVMMVMLIVVMLVISTGGDDDLVLAMAAMLRRVCVCVFHLCVHCLLTARYGSACLQFHRRSSNVLIVSCWRPMGT